MNEENIPVQDLAQLFSIFADPTRIRILYALYKEERASGELADLLGMTPSAISHQIRILKMAGLVKTRREGKQVLCSLSDAHVEMILRTGREHIEEG